MLQQQMPANFNSQSPDDLTEVANFLYNQIKTPTLILLKGQLGAGKTTLCKYLLEKYGIDKNQVKSPTYSLINSFTLPSIQINHLDLYRLEQLDQILTEEIRQLMEVKPSLTIIEWPERLDLISIIKPSLQVLLITLTLNPNSTRQISIQNKSLSL